MPAGTTRSGGQHPESTGEMRGPSSAIRRAEDARTRVQGSSCAADACCAMRPAMLGGLRKLLLGGAGHRRGVRRGSQWHRKGEM